MFKVKSTRSWNINADNLDEMVSFYRDFVGGAEGRSMTIGGVTVAHVDLGSSSAIFGGLPTPGVVVNVSSVPAEAESRHPKIRKLALHPLTSGPARLRQPRIRAMGIAKMAELEARIPSLKERRCTSWWSKTSPS